MTKIHTTPPAPAGYVCPHTGRVAVLVSDYANSDLNGDVTAYWYNAEAAEFGLDPWRLVEGVDPHVNGAAFDVCFVNGTFKTVGPLMTLYLTAEDAGRLYEAESKA